MFITKCSCFRRPPIGPAIGTNYTMLDPAFDNGHRARYIENGVVNSTDQRLATQFCLFKSFF